MPSGAKKRKAAKKKKEIESTTSSNNNNPLQRQQQQQGENELKSIDEKGSDGDSPAYRNHGDDQNNQFNEGSEEVEEIEVKPSAVVVAKSSEDIGNDGKVGEVEGGKEGVVEIEWDMKSEESLEKNDSPKELSYGSRNNGGSNDVIETGTAENAKDEPYNSAAESSADSVKEGVNSVAEVSDDLVKAVASVSEMQSGGTVNDILEKPLVSPVAETDLAVKRNEDKVPVLPDEDVRISSLKEPETREFDGKVYTSVSQSPIPESTKGVENVEDSNAAESSENQPPVAPLMVHKTSWLSCCGLFDVLSGSSR